MPVGSFRSEYPVSDVGNSTLCEGQKRAVERGDEIVITEQGCSVNGYAAKMSGDRQRLGQTS